VDQHEHVIENVLGAQLEGAIRVDSSTRHEFSTWYENRAKVMDLNEGPLYLIGCGVALNGKIPRNVHSESAARHLASEACKNASVHIPPDGNAGRLQVEDRTPADRSSSIAEVA